MYETPSLPSQNLPPSPLAVMPETALASSRLPEMRESLSDTLPPQEVGVLGSLATEYVAPQTEVIDLAVSTAQLTGEVARRTGEYVRLAPSFAEQRADATRTNLVTYVAEAKVAKGAYDDYGTTRTLSEHAMLNELGGFLERTITSPTIDPEYRLQAQSMLENLTFIGKTEYDEAVANIAQSWRDELSQNPELQICAYADTGGLTHTVKSDEYLRDSILKHFSDEELANLQDRIVTHPENLTAGPNAKIVVLDDWSISGEQLRDTVGLLKREYPMYAAAIEVQLVAAHERSLSDDWAGEDVPVKSYFLAHSSLDGAAPESGAHITGFHSSVDHDFDNLFGNFASHLGVAMPAGTNIVRPYRNGERLTQIERLHEKPVEEAEDWDFDDDISVSAA